MSADKLLFTPGPLTTSPSVKAAMQRDLGSRDREFIALVRDVRARLVALAGGGADDWTAVIMQGSGTFGVEAVLGTAVPRGGRVLVAVNGAYGARMVEICRVAGIDARALEFPEEQPCDPVRIAAALDDDPAAGHVAVVHCETTTGLLNPVEAIAAACAARGRSLIVDAMSSFGAVPLALGAAGIDWVVSSANKCIEGVPGFSFVVARRSALAATAGNARSLSLDVLAQWKGLEGNGQFRFTPPTHALLAFRQALDELDAEGGVAGRARRYRRNRDVVVAGMRRLGFQTYLPEELVGPIITSFRFPADPGFVFEEFYGRLSDRGFVIYPGKVSRADCFRIGHIGRVDPEASERLVVAAQEVLAEMGVRP